MYEQARREKARTCCIVNISCPILEHYSFMSSASQVNCKGDHNTATSHLNTSNHREMAKQDATCRTEQFLRGEIVEKTSQNTLSIDGQEQAPYETTRLENSDNSHLSDQQQELDNTHQQCGGCQASGRRRQTTVFLHRPILCCLPLHNSAVLVIVWVVCFNAKAWGQTLSSSNHQQQVYPGAPNLAPETSSQSWQCWGAVNIQSTHQANCSCQLHPTRTGRN